MILSNLSSRGTLRGTIYRGGGGGVTDYNQLSGKPQINDVTIEGNHSGNYYSLMDTDDIEIIQITDIQRGNNYGITLFGTTYGIINMDFDQNESGLVPGYSVGDAGKILSTNGWINPPTYTPPSYSTTEQNTGQKGLDGSDIYFRTFTGTSSSTQFTLGINVKEIYGINGYILKDSYKFIYPYRDTSDFINASITPSKDVRFTTSNYFSGGDYMFTVYYTKN